ncbi:MAG: D-cysteine desulfhydrase family protein [Pseudomonadota bacterium]
MSNALPALSHPRTELVAQATPCTRLNRLSARLGIDLWVKRDDLAGTTLGGNKSRQLEFYFGAAEAAGADTVLITGAVQSNFVRTTVAAANALGMHAVVQLEDRVAGMSDTYHHSGNAWLTEMLGAEIMRYPEGEDEAGADAALRVRADRLRAEGRRPYVIPLAAGNPPLGALGYVHAAAEIHAEHPDVDAVVVPSGSGLTHAGTVAGLRACGNAVSVFGSCVRRAEAAQRARLRRTLDHLAEIEPSLTRLPDTDIQLWDGALSPGYGQAGAVALDAMRLMASQEGMLLDPVYSGKAFAAIPALLQRGVLQPGQKVVFVHTGGLGGLFAYADSVFPVATAASDPQG